MRKAPQRRGPACPHFPSCPGCPLAERPYAEQLAHKRRRVAAALAAVLPETVRIEVPPLAPAPEWVGYRVQAKLVVRAQRGGPLVGLYSPGTHRVVDTSRCPLHHPLIQRAIPVLRAALDAERVPIHGSERRGVRYLLLRASTSESRLLVTLVSSLTPIAAAPRLARRLRSHLPLGGLLVNENTSAGNVILGARTKRIWGEHELRERYGNIVLSASPTAFVQGNARMAARIYAAIAEAAALGGRERALDLYCGVGGIALTLAAAAREVVAVEEVDDAVRAARQNARRNRLPNVRFETGRVEQWLPALAGANLDVVTLNPPRKGCGERVARAVATLRAPRVLYLSCAPESFARDTAILVAGGYRLRRLQPFDLLPQTDHVEVLGCFELESGR